MKGNKLYTTKEMKPSDTVETIKKEPTHTIEEKRGRFHVKDLSGTRVAVFFSMQDAEDFIR